MIDLLSQETYACRYSKPQGLEEHSKLGAFGTADHMIFKDFIGF